MPVGMCAEMVCFDSIDSIPNHTSSVRHGEKRKKERGIRRFQEVKDIRKEGEKRKGEKHKCNSVGSGRAQGKVTRSLARGSKRTFLSFSMVGKKEGHTEVYPSRLVLSFSFSP